MDFDHFVWAMQVQNFEPVDLLQASKDAREVFGSDAGQRLLRFLAAQCFFLAPTLQRGPGNAEDYGASDLMATAIAEGQRMAFLNILALLDVKRTEEIFRAMQPDGGD